MVVPIAHQNGVLVFKTEGHAPVSIDFDRRVAGQLPLKRVQVPPREIHRSGACGAIENGKLVFKLVRVGGVDSGLWAVSEKLFKPRVPGRLDCPQTVTHSNTTVKASRSWLEMRLGKLKF